jgi:NAD+ diphosphatase
MSPPGSGELENYKGALERFGRVSLAPGGGEIWGLLAEGAEVPGSLIAVSRRDLAVILGQGLFLRSCAAFQMMSLYADNKFCGRCGAPMADCVEELARQCQECSRMVFPSLSPAMIVAVEKEGRLLLGHNASFPEGRYSVLAGFVEPGETVEQAVAREVYEESGIRVKNIRYAGSQPWPFPASMMLGFRADWESGEPVPDGAEITDVRFFSPYCLPNLPPRISISRKLIDGWLARSNAEAPQTAD